MTVELKCINDKPMMTEAPKYSLKGEGIILYKKNSKTNQMVVVGILDSELGKAKIINPEKRIKGENADRLSMWECSFYSHLREVVSYTEYYEFNDEYSLANIELEKDTQEILVGDYVIGVTKVVGNLEVYTWYYDQYRCHSINGWLAITEVYPTKDGEFEEKVSAFNGYIDSRGSYVDFHKIKDIPQWAVDGKVKVCDWIEYNQAFYNKKIGKITEEEFIEIKSRNLGEDTQNSILYSPAK